MLLPKARSHIVAIFLIFCKNLRIFVFHVCVLNSACIICPALPLSCLSESHNAFSCILIRASLIVTGQDTVSHSPLSLNICICCVQSPAPVTKQGDQNLNMNITKLTHKISTHTGRSFCWLRPLSQLRSLIVSRENLGHVYSEHIINKSERCR